MTDRIDDTMNLKFTNHLKNSNANVKSAESLVKEERRRTGRYIAILVGIMLFILALYHAWVRRIPVVASLVVPALIMFVYVAWVLYTASRDKHRMLDAEAALNAQNHEGEADIQISEVSQNIETPTKSSKETSNLNTPDDKHWNDISTTFVKVEKNVRSDEHNGFIMPIILINDKPPEDLDQKWLTIVDKVSNNDKIKVIQNRRKYKRKYCRKRRYAAFKRSYSIA